MGPNFQALHGDFLSDDLSDDTDPFEAEDSISSGDTTDGFLEFNDIPDYEMESPVSAMEDTTEIMEEQLQATDGFESESVLAFLLRKGDYHSIQALSSPKPDRLSANHEQARSSFMPTYAKDLASNRAIAWYEKLATIFGTDFKAIGGDLSLEYDSYNQEHVESIRAFTQTHKARLEDASPIQALAGLLKAQLSKDSSFTYATPEDLSHDGDMDTYTSMHDVANMDNADVFLSSDVNAAVDDDPVFKVDLVSENPGLAIQLSDLSNKAVAKELQLRNVTEDSVRSYLVEENFPDTRIAEVLAIYRYLNASNSPKSSLVDFHRSRQATTALSQRDGDTEFNATF